VNQETGDPVVDPHISPVRNHRWFLLFWGLKLSVIEVMTVRKGIGRTVRKGIYLALWIIAATLLYKPMLQAYHGYMKGEQGQEQQEVLDIDKKCRIFADTRQCLCRHSRTNERLSIPYDECASLARKL
jgi:hypothetical protein